METNFDNTELLQFEDQRATDMFGKKVANAKLMALRAQMPFINIMPFPNSVLTVKLLAGVPQDFNLPDQTKLVRFNCNGEFFVSRQGTARLPIVGDPVDTGSVYKPDDEWWYIEEGQQISIVSVADAYVTVSCFIQL